MTAVNEAQLGLGQNTQSLHTPVEEENHLWKQPLWTRKQDSAAAHSEKKTHISLIILILIPLNQINVRSFRPDLRYLAQQNGHRGNSV